MQDIAVQTPTTAQSIKGLVEVESLSVAFSCDDRTIKVLDNINFQVEPGSFVCVLGSSGCGKSTLLNAIAGFIRPKTSASRR